MRVFPQRPACQIATIEAFTIRRSKEFRRSGGRKGEPSLGKPRRNGLTIPVVGIRGHLFRVTGWLRHVALKVHGLQRGHLRGGSLERSTSGGSPFSPTDERSAAQLLRREQRGFATESQARTSNASDRDCARRFSRCFRIPRQLLRAIGSPRSDSFCHCASHGLRGAREHLAPPLGASRVHTPASSPATRRLPLAKHIEGPHANRTWRYRTFLQVTLLHIRRPTAHASPWPCEHCSPDGTSLDSRWQSHAVKETRRATMPDSAPGELIAFKRVDTVPGVEIIEAYNTGSQWGFVATMYALAMPLTWSGDVFFDRRAYSLDPGTVFANQLGDVARNRSRESCRLVQGSAVRATEPYRLPRRT